MGQEYLLQLEIFYPAHSFMMPGSVQQLQRRRAKHPVGGTLRREPLLSRGASDSSAASAAVGASGGEGHHERHYAHSESLSSRTPQTSLTMWRRLAGPLKQTFKAKLHVAWHGYISVSRTCALSGGSLIKTFSMRSSPTTFTPRVRLSQSHSLMYSLENRAEFYLHGEKTQAGHGQRCMNRPRMALTGRGSKTCMNGHLTLV